MYFLILYVAFHILPIGLSVAFVVLLIKSVISVYKQIILDRQTDAALKDAQEEIEQTYRTIQESHASKQSVQETLAHGLQVRKESDAVLQKSKETLAKIAQQQKKSEKKDE